MKMNRLSDFIILIICLSFISAVLYDLHKDRKKKVVVTSFIGVSNPEKGSCKFNGHYLDNLNIIEFENTCCKFSIGDTVEISQ